MKTQKNKVPPQRARKRAGFTVNALAERHHIDRRTLKKYLAGVKPIAHEGRSALYAEGDVLEAILAQTKGKSELRDQKLFEEVRKLKIANDLKEGKLVPVDNVCACVGRILSRVDEIIEQKLVNEYPSAVAGMDVPQAVIYGKRLGDSLRVEFQKLGDEWK